MPRKKLSEFGRLRRRNFLPLKDCARLFGVTERTIRRWDYHEPRPHILDRLRQTECHLSAFHPDWRGFKIDRLGKLRGPEGFIVGPEQLRHLILSWRAK
jgi:hypothetical protein